MLLSGFLLEFFVLLYFFVVIVLVGEEFSSMCAIFNGRVCLSTRCLLCLLLRIKHLCVVIVNIKL